MAERKTTSALAQSKLAQTRLRRGITQAELAEATGLRLRTIQELDRGELGNPGIRYLVMIAAALGVEMSEICEERWLQAFKLARHPLYDGEQTEPIEALPHQPGRFANTRELP